MITIEEIAPYLPYDLAVQFLGSPNKDHYNMEGIYNQYAHDATKYDEWNSLKIKKIGKIRQLKIRKNYVVFYVGKAANYLKTCYSNDIMPIFRPLSDLTNEIEVDGKKFVPIVELAKIAFPSYEWGINLCKNKHFAISNSKSAFRFDGEYYVFLLDNNPLMDQLQLFQQLYKWHFWLGNQGRFGKDIIDINILIQKS